MRVTAILLVVATAGWAAAKPLSVVATIPDLASVAEAVGGDRVRVLSASRGGRDPHFLDAKPSLILRLARADALIIVGRELEQPWLPGLLRSARNRRILPATPGYVDCSAGIRILEEHHHGPLTRAEGDVHPHGNPHWYLDPGNHLIAARTIERALARLDPAGADGYAARRAAFTTKLEAHLAAWDRRMARWRHAPIVTYHRSWVYFADRFGFDMDHELEPRPGIPPSPGHMLAVLEAIAAERIPLIIQDPYYDPAAGLEVSRRTGAAFLVLPSSVGGTDDVKDVFDMFDTITGRIDAALTKLNYAPPAKRAHAMRHHPEGEADREHDHDHSHDHEHTHDHGPGGHGTGKETRP